MTADRSEGDVNTSPLRGRWLRDHIDEATRALLNADAEVFLHQAHSTPCLDVVECAEGSWLTDLQGRRILDCHGNSVHQVGHGHPAVVAAIKAQLDLMPFCPRRYTCRVAIKLAERLATIAPDPTLAG